MTLSRKPRPVQWGPRPSPLLGLTGTRESLAGPHSLSQTCPGPVLQGQDKTPSRCCSLAFHRACGETRPEPALRPPLLRCHQSNSERGPATRTPGEPQPPGPGVVLGGKQTPQQTDTQPLVPPVLTGAGRAGPWWLLALDRSHSSLSSGENWKT